MKKINILIVALFFVFTIALFGQDISSGRIYAAQGTDFVILRDGKRILYNADRLNDGPIDFLQGDVFQTGPQSSTDIQFGTNGPLLKMVENSSIGFVGSNSAVSVLALNLYYGRIRVRNLDSGPAIHVSSKNGLVEVTKGDTGIDYVVRNDLVTLQSEAFLSTPVLYVTNFEGDTNVFPANDGTAVSVLPQLLVREGETVSVEFVSSLSYVERNATGSVTTDFWRTYDFAPVPASSAAITKTPNAPVYVTPPPPVPPTETAPSKKPTVSSNVEEIPYTLPAVNPEYEAVIKRKNTAILTSLIFLAGGLVLEGIGLYYQYDENPDMGYFFNLSGVLVSGVGVASLIHGFTIKLE
jgi:hypothetical protein